MLIALTLWLCLVPLTLVTVWVAVYRPPAIRERGAALQPWYRKPRGRHRKGVRLTHLASAIGPQRDARCE